MKIFNNYAFELDTVLEEVVYDVIDTAFGIGLKVAVLSTAQTIEGETLYVIEKGDILELAQWHKLRERDDVGRFILNIVSSEYSLDMFDIVEVFTEADYKKATVYFEEHFIKQTPQAYKYLMDKGAQQIKTFPQPFSAPITIGVEDVQYLPNYSHLTPQVVVQRLTEGTMYGQRYQLRKNNQLVDDWLLDISTLYEVVQGQIWSNEFMEHSRITNEDEYVRFFVPKKEMTYMVLPMEKGSTYTGDDLEDFVDYDKLIPMEHYTIEYAQLHEYELPMFNETGELLNAPIIAMFEDGEVRHYSNQYIVEDVVLSYDSVMLENAKSDVFNPTTERLVRIVENKQGYSNGFLLLNESLQSDERVQVKDFDNVDNVLSFIEQNRNSALVKDIERALLETFIDEVPYK